MNKHAKPNPELLTKTVLEHKLTVKETAELFNRNARHQQSTNRKIQRDKVGTNGKITLRWHGKLHRLYIGAKRAGKPVSILLIGNHLTVINPQNEQLLGTYQLDKNQLYFKNQLLN